MMKHNHTLTHSCWYRNNFICFGFIFFLFFFVFFLLLICFVSIRKNHYYQFSKNFWTKRTLSVVHLPERLSIKINCGNSFHWKRQNKRKKRMRKRKEKKETFRVERWREWRSLWWFMHVDGESIFELCSCCHWVSSSRVAELDLLRVQHLIIWWFPYICTMNDDKFGWTGSHCLGSCEIESARRNV